MSALDITVSATEANRSFSKLLKAVQQGGRVTITAYGQPVAMLAPPETQADAEIERRRAALKALQEHWATLEPMTIEPWTRDELYERDPARS